MTEKLRTILESIVESDTNNDLWMQTIVAAEILLKGDYKGYEEDLEYIENRNIETGFDFENVVSQGDWYFQETEIWKEKFEKEDSKMLEVFGNNENLCLECNVAFCNGRYTAGQCE